MYVSTFPIVVIFFGGYVSEVIVPSYAVGFIYTPRKLTFVSFKTPRSTGPRLNIKTVLSTYGDFHVKDKTAVRTSYL